MLDCGHPDGCEDRTDEDDVYCRWCSTNARHKAEIQALKDCLGKQSVTIWGGLVDLHFKGDVGMLNVHGGTVNFKGEVGKLICGDMSQIGQRPV